MQIILVPIDFSPESRMTCDYAGAFAQAAGARIVLINVYTEPLMVGEEPEVWTRSAQGLKIGNDILMDKEIRKLKQKYGIEVTGDTIIGFIGDTIRNAAKEMKADLIIMGMKDRNKGKHPGGSILKMVRNSDIPLLIVPESATFRPLKNIVLAVDFFEMIERSSFNPLFNMLKKFDSFLRVIHIQESDAGIKSAEEPRKVQLGFILSKVSYLYQKIESDSVKKGINEYVQHHPTDLLAIVAHHHNILKKIFGAIHNRFVSLELMLPLLVLKNK